MGELGPRGTYDLLDHGVFNLLAVPLPKRVMTPTAQAKGLIRTARYSAGGTDCLAHSEV